MTDRDALLAAIRAEPDDDTARLVFADWLDDYGHERDARHAEMIRFQCAMSRTPHRHNHGRGNGCARCKMEKRNREYELWAYDHLGPPQLAGLSLYRRGFIEAVACDVLIWQAVADQDREKHPIQRLLTTAPQGVLLRGFMESLDGVPEVGVIGATERRTQELAEYACAAPGRLELRFYDGRDYFLKFWWGRDPAARRLLAAAMPSLIHARVPAAPPG